MAVFKCKMCGGTIEFEQGATVGVCDSCGTKQTLPRLDDDRKINLYDRANHFRRNNEFDKAAGIYEQILNEDTSDAEAYWSLVLCRYGIEYVEDPETHKRIPTVNRAQFTSVFDDDNYKSAIQNADGYQRVVYEEEANAINEIQKGILAISQKEEPFDVFICYKETDANGRRTQDSVLANDLYHQLTQEGFKVFFARITLEDKLGTAYEPYIFAALNSAKVMVVLGTKPEHFNAVWVKNEWSRYLAIVKKSGGKKILIPAYKDMDPYDLPEEFSHLQAQDMSKLGFMQDLIRGIKKIVSSYEDKATVKETVVMSSVNSNAAPLLKRAFMFLEDGEWTKADDFCEQVLNIDPENPQAYLGKLMAELQVRNKEDLADCKYPFDKRNNYQKAVRFGKDGLADELQGYVKHINDRNENERLTGIYNSAIKAMGEAATENSFKYAADTFRSISGFKDSDNLADQCLEKAEICRKDTIYNSAVAKMHGNVVTQYQEAIVTLESLKGWKDSESKILECKKTIEEIKAKEEADRLEAERLAQEERIAAEKKARKRKIAAAITIPTIICAVFAVILFTVIIPSVKYNSAVNLYNEGKYEEALAEFEALDKYQNSAEWADVCRLDIRYEDAAVKYEEGKFDEAMEAFKGLGGYKESAELAEKCRLAINERKYKKAKAHIDNGEIEEALLLLRHFDYADSQQVLSELIKSNPQYAAVGDIITFGAYEQDNDESNGQEKIEWLVLEKDGNNALIISRYALDCQKYNSSITHVTWEICSLREWLNGTFLNSAFSGSELEIILNSNVTADKNPSYSTSPENRTTDKVFLLSIAEVDKYFSSDDARQCQGTAYCNAQGADKTSNGNCWWWLRSPGYNSYYAADVNSAGSVSNYGYRVNYYSGAVRPALWINLGS